VFCSAGELPRVGLNDADVNLEVTLHDLSAIGASVIENRCIEDDRLRRGRKQSTCNSYMLVRRLTQRLKLRLHRHERLNTDRATRQTNERMNAYVQSTQTQYSNTLIPSFDGNLLTQRHEISSQETRDSRLSYGENQVSLSHLGSKQWL